MKKILSTCIGFSILISCLASCSNNTHNMSNSDISQTIASSTTTEGNNSQSFEISTSNSDTYENQTIETLPSEKTETQLPVPDNYDKCLFKNDLLCVIDENTHKYGYINNRGEIEIALKFDYANNYAPNGLAAVGVGEWGEEKYGFIDKKGNYVIEPQFDFVSSFNNDGIAVAVEKTGKAYKYGFIDTTGQYIVEPQFPIHLISPVPENNIDEYNFSPNGLAAVSIMDEAFSTKNGYINTDGEFVIESEDYIDTLNFNSDGLARVKIYDDELGTLYGYIDESGNYKIKPRFKYAEDFAPNGLAIVGTNDEDEGLKFGFINKSGDYVVEPIYCSVEPFADNGLAVVNIGDQRKGKFGYVDQNGNYVIEPMYDYAGSFSNGVASVRIDGKKGFINENNEFILEPTFKSLGDMTKHGLAIASDGDLGPYGYINIKGEYVIEPQFDDAISFLDDGFTIGHCQNLEQSTPFYNVYEFSLISSNGDIISIGTLRPCRWRAW